MPNPQTPVNVSLACQRRQKIQKKHVVALVRTQTGLRERSHPRCSRSKRLRLKGIGLDPSLHACHALPRHVMQEGVVARRRLRNGTCAWDTSSSSCTAAGAEADGPISCTSSWRQGTPSGAAAPDGMVANVPTCGAERGSVGLDRTWHASARESRRGCAPAVARGLLCHHLSALDVRAEEDCGERHDTTEAREARRASIPLVMIRSLGLWMLLQNIMTQKNRGWEVNANLHTMLPQKRKVCNA